jgi:hypothetical protein
MTLYRFLNNLATMKLGDLLACIKDIGLIKVSHVLIIYNLE